MSSDFDSFRTLSAQRHRRPRHTLSDSFRGLFWGSGPEGRGRPLCLAGGFLMLLQTPRRLPQTLFFDFFQKNPRAHKNKIGTPTPPKPKIPPPPKTRNFMDMGFSCGKNAFFQGVHKIDAAISGPRIAD